MANFTTTYPLCINQGATYERIFYWQQGCACNVVGGPSPVNLTGYSASMQIRPFPLSTTVYYDATNDIVLTPLLGIITLTIDATDTETFTWWTGVYDLLMTSAGGQVTRLLQGPVTISPGVTP